MQHYREQRSIAGSMSAVRRTAHERAVARIKLENAKKYVRQVKVGQANCFYGDALVHKLSRHTYKIVWFGGDAYCTSADQAAEVLADHA